MAVVEDGVADMEKKPEWLKVRYNQDAVNEVAALMRDLKLNTVCKEANCPNLGECYQQAHLHLHDPRQRLHAQLPLLQRHHRSARSRPTRRSRMNVAEAAKKLNLRHVVLTCSTRDDLPDGGAEQFARMRPRHSRGLPRHDGGDADSPT